MPALEMSGTVLSAPEHPHAKVQSPTAQTGRTIRPGFEGCFCWCAPRAVRCFRQALQGIAMHIILWFSCAFLHECEQKREEMVSGCTLVLFGCQLRIPVTQHNRLYGDRYFLDEQAGSFNYFRKRNLKPTLGFFCIYALTYGVYDRMMLFSP